MKELKERLALEGFVVKPTESGSGSMVTAGGSDFGGLLRITNEVLGKAPKDSSPVFWRSGGETQATLVIHGTETRLYF